MGALDVQRAGGSLGMFDLWAVFPDHLKLIQVKKTKAMLTFGKLQNEIAALIVPSYCKKALWVWYSYRPTRKNKTKPNYKGWIFYDF